MKHFLLALQFLTVLPVKIKTKLKDKDYPESLAFFPLAGAIIGVVLVFCLVLLKAFPVIVQAAFLIVVSAVITGGLHIDGFADTCDGFCGAASQEKILRIMKDSSIGVMGVAGIVCLLILKFSLLASIPLEGLWRVLIVMAVFSRWMQAYACTFTDYPRQEGKAKFFMSKAARGKVLLSGVLVLLVCIILLRFEAIPVVMFSFLAGYIFMVYARRKIAGLTGDTIGAVNEISETAVLFFGLIFYGTNNLFIPG